MYREQWIKQVRNQMNRRPNRLCFFIKHKDGKEKYNRFQEICLFLRISMPKEAIRLVVGRSRRYIFEGLENNPMPF